ncbi:uncharacterized protein LOC122094726 [Macadamia integrifolia]|uniref:uncharacterized protein LOC122094726 n=1 Tax=Macadamia integrifolia TaxID=60698 RepID=UPI001C533E31|nr:uncharacterized protein LOC122094726 [Macadamia integrifolia]
MGERRLLWEELINFANMVDQAWTVCGDFNAILAPSEKVEERPPCSQSMKELSRFVNEFALFDAEEQGAFVQEKCIHDNIALVQEVAQDINRKSKGGNLILKLDMAKAYNRLEWSFLYKVLSISDFSSLWIDLIRKTLKNCWFSVVMDGGLYGFLKSFGGIRQEDPLFPNLFILTEEVLSRGLTALFEEGRATYFNLPRGCSRISHSLFADDTIILLGD